MTAPVPLSAVGFSRNAAVPADYLNAMVAELLRQGRLVFARRTSGRAVASGALTVLPLEAETADTNGGGMFDALIGSYLTIVDPGAYLLLGQVPWPNSAAATMTPYILRNGTTADSIIATGNTVNSVASGSGDGPSSQVFGAGLFDQGDRLYLAAKHNLGSSLTTSTDRGGVWLAATYLGGGAG